MNADIISFDLEVNADKLLVFTLAVAMLVSQSLDITTVNNGTLSVTTSLKYEVEF